ncbi:hypothetical protein CDO73_01585 [Saccharibacillus sp. O23]|uniref:hypothetical protein n=1 Tax=Saccharibacillus sp. O23 TaxID=2009338 RepID=UPI000B4E2FB1|nr:hypothetical protein [Saccharibacillus sp. O23]OWR32326.1 hypothetical protein CDO73_01585 [Saccharibacillus sp. O23]
MNRQTDLMHPRLNILDAYIYKRENKQPIEPREIKVTYYIGQNEKWTSVLNEHFQWGTIEQVGQMLSTLVPEPVMTVGFFAVNELEKLLSIPLWVDADWVAIDPELAAKYSKLEINVM